jgi:hypothetical protein
MKQIVFQLSNCLRSGEVRLFVALQSIRYRSHSVRRVTARAHPLVDSSVVQSDSFAAYRACWLRDPPAPLAISSALGFFEGECGSSAS